MLAKKLATLAVAVTFLIIETSVVYGKQNKIYQATRGDVASLQESIRHKSRNVYLVNLHEKSCSKVVPRDGTKWAFVTQDGLKEFTFNRLQVRILLRRKIVKEPHRGYRHKIPSSIRTNLTLTRTIKTAKNFPFVWETHTTKKICVTYAAYTDGRVQCRRYISAGQPLYMFAIGIKAANKISGGTCQV